MLGGGQGDVCVGRRARAVHGGAVLLVASIGFPGSAVADSTPVVLLLTGHPGIVFVVTDILGDRRTQDLLTQT